MAYNHGIKINEMISGTRPLQDISTASIGLVSIAEDADESVFPLNKPVLLIDVAGAVGKAGEDGLLADALGAISDQVTAPVTVVRVAKSTLEDPVAAAAATQTNIIGTILPTGERTGLQALLTAEAINGVKPRILGIPGYDTKEVATALTTIAQKLRGFAYAKAVGASIAEAATYRGDFSARELMLIDGEASDFAGSAVARALGLRAKLDQQIGWHKTISNAAINGVTGIAHPRSLFTGLIGRKKMSTARPS